VTLDPPVLVTVSDRDLLFPTFTLPKLSDVGFAPSVPCESPVPVSGIFSVGLEPLEITLTLPLDPVEDAGVKVTVKVALWPAVKVSGVVIPARLYPLPLILA
jgi:hypothetical protein